MNKENINRVIEAIRKEDNFFNMLEYSMTSETAKIAGIDYSGKCRTPACICGWANHLRTGGNELVDYGEHEAAGIFLGLHYRQRCALFLPYPKRGLDGDCDSTNDFRKSITKEDAIRTLEILRDTGKVDWSHAGGRIHDNIF